MDTFAGQPISMLQFESAGVETSPAAVLAAIVYADLFDYPLTLEELARYQIGSRLSTGQIAGMLATDPRLDGNLAHERGYYSLAGRRSLERTRLERERRSAKLWRRAGVYSRWISRLPYVRMVAVTGALAVNNVGTLPDIDLLVVAREGRVWLCRRALIMCVRVARLFGDDLCPNYIISDQSLDLDQRDFFTAHELAQMVPVYGLGIYRRMLKRNPWAWRYLPCAFDGAGPHRPVRASLRTGGVRYAHRSLPLKRVRPTAETLLGQPVFDRLEAWELRRMRAKLHPLLGDDAEVVCSPSQCKGHTGLNRQKVMLRFRNRMREVGLLDAAPRVVLDDFSLLPDEL